MGGKREWREREARGRRDRNERGGEVREHLKFVPKEKFPGYASAYK